MGRKESNQSNKRFITSAPEYMQDPKLIIHLDLNFNKKSQTAIQEEAKSMSHKDKRKTFFSEIYPEVPCISFKLQTKPLGPDQATQ